MVAQDKIEHWAFGFVLTFFGLILWPFYFAGVGFTILKEIEDSRAGKPFDLKDISYGIFGANCAGAILVIWIVL